MTAHSPMFGHERNGAEAIMMRNSLVAADLEAGRTVKARPRQHEQPGAFTFFEALSRYRRGFKRVVRMSKHAFRAR